MLFKATAQGLVPVEKIISRKGRSFTQTFHIRPEGSPKDTGATVRLNRIRAIARQLDIPIDESNELYNKFMEWGKANLDDFNKPLDQNYFGVRYPDGSWYADPKTILKYAIVTNSSLENAQQYAESEYMLSEGHTPIQSESDMKATDGYGQVWSYNDLIGMVNWCHGNVAKPRELAKQLFAAREYGDENTMRSVMDDSDEISVDTLRTLLGKAVRMESDILYRGTRGVRWHEAEVGQTVPFGVGSFSKNYDIARKFASYSQHGGKQRVPVVLFLENSDEAPIVGVDVDNLINKSVDDTGNYNKAVATVGLTFYRREEEVVVAAPYIEIVRREEDSSAVFLTVRPVKMNLVSYMKSQFETHASETGLLDALSAEFDLPLHRDVEEALFKAVPHPGLMAVKKPVSKKGKTFYQTFYVKTPESEKPDKKKTVDDAKQPKGKSKVWNMADGFYVTKFDSSQSPLTYRVKIPEEHIHSVIKHRGRTLVVARGLIGDPEFGDVQFSTWRVYDQRSGTSLTPAGETPDSAIAIMKEMTANVPQKKWDSILDNAPKIGSKGVVYDQEVEDVYEPKAPVKDTRKAAIKLMAKMDDDAESVTGYMAPHTLAEWIEEQIPNQQEFRWLLEEKELRSDILIAAVKDHLSVADARTQEDTIADIRTAARSTELMEHRELTREDVKFWADQHTGTGFPYATLKDGIDFNDWRILDDSYDINMPGEDIVAYAVANNLTILEAHRHFERVADDIRAGIDGESSFEDFGGNEWTLGDLRWLSAWVGGEVESNRKDAKYMFAGRRGKDFVDDYGLTFAGVVESHLTEITDVPVLYRGTKNLSWQEAAIGDVIPFGMGSFSKSVTAAYDFSDGPVLVFENTAGPIYGIDVNRLVADGTANNVHAVHTLNIDRYPNEKEVITMAPSFRITRMEKVSTGYSNAYRTHVYVEPVGMDLVQYAKSQSESRSELIARMERSFDYPLHREPEES
jgi:hypothetical protein